MFYYLEHISRSSLVLHKAFVLDFYEPLCDAVLDKVMNASEAQLKSTRKERFEDILKAIDDLYHRTRDSDLRKETMNNINLQLAKKFLELDFLERRIDGVRLLQELCKTARIYSFGNSTVSQMKMSGVVSSFIKEQGILD